ncbi:MAG: ATP-dependent DNA helicase RecG [Cyanobacteriota bacterium]
MTIDHSELNNIKRAIEVEIKHQYIDLKGKKSTFSRYISSLAKNYYKIPPKDKRWADIALLFNSYDRMNISERIKAINTLQSVLIEALPQKITVKKVKKQSDSKESLEANKKKSKVDSPEETDVQFVKGVGPVLANKLNSLHIFNAYDLLTYYPRDHIDFKTQAKIADIEIGQDVTIFGTIKRVNAYNARRNPKLSILTLHIYDGTDTITASWFYSRSNKYILDRYKEQYPKGAQVLISGRVKFDSYTNKKSIDRPEIEIVYDSPEEIDSLHAARIVPIYRLTEGLGIKALRRAINNAIETYLPVIDETLPAEILKKYDLIDKKTAIKQIHFPDELEQIQEAKKRLIFEEFFIHQLHLALVRKSIKKNTDSISIKTKPGGLVEQFKGSLPFKLTNAQEAVFKEILSDLVSSEPMHRLLQGDVGSGKTVVACMALLAAVENGYQAAIMAPTEVLAEQHYRKFTEWLAPLGIRIGIFLGKHGIKQRREMRQNLENGLTNIAIGTHALIQEEITFNKLGMVVIDEQHRFGVRQRTALKNKGINPELLTMTATPIPRTLALSMHGDLDISIIDEMPPGRKPVRTHVLSPATRIRSYRLIEEEIKKKRQAFIVFPLIEESEKLTAKAATAEAEKLRKTVFKDYSVGLVHGKLRSVEKEKVMEEFRKGKYDILVATTVIEVGIDVPNATVMMIENADRFGLAQLHQLRGRVGRSELQSYCMLVTNTNSRESKNRLLIMEQTNNGFIIAEHDLALRGPGEFIGTKQSGVPDFVLANLVEHINILEMAREAAFEIVNSDKEDEYQQLLNKLSSNFSETFELLGSG